MQLDWFIRRNSSAAFTSSALPPAARAVGQRSSCVYPRDVHTKKTFKKIHTNFHKYIRSKNETTFRLSLGAASSLPLGRASTAASEGTHIEADFPSRWRPVLRRRRGGRGRGVIKVVELIFSLTFNMKWWCRGEWGLIDKFDRHFDKWLNNFGK